MSGDPPPVCTPVWQYILIMIEEMLGLTNGSLAIGGFHTETERAPLVEIVTECEAKLRETVIAFGGHAKPPKDSTWQGLLKNVQHLAAELRKLGATQTDEALTPVAQWTDTALDNWRDTLELLTGWESEPPTKK